MTGKGEYYVRCRNCGRLIKVFHTPTQVYCTNCNQLFDYDTQDVIFSGITTIRSDYHYEWKEEKNLEDELTKYKRAFEILKEILSLSKDKSLDGKVDYYTLYFTGQFPYETFKYLEKEEYELLEELMKSE